MTEPFHPGPTFRAFWNYADLPTRAFAIAATVFSSGLASEENSRRIAAGCFPTRLASSAFESPEASRRGHVGITETRGDLARRSSGEIDPLPGGESYGMQWISGLLKSRPDLRSAH